MLVFINFKSYLKQFLGGPSDVDVEALKHENDDLKRKVEELQARIDELTSGVRFIIIMSTIDCRRTSGC